MRRFPNFIGSSSIEENPLSTGLAAAPEASSSDTLSLHLAGFYANPDLWPLTGQILPDAVSFGNEPIGR